VFVPEVLLENCALTDLGKTLEDPLAAICEWAQSTTGMVP
jgi:DNA-binding HxlR family transcriptional regulator